ncbi:MAG: NAD(P)/FAD-dependent oxidoreductase [Candidatus Diapherotrites archaeon]
MENFDVIIVGAGPAGLFAAQKCAEANLKTLLLERKQEIGAPKRCAEGLSLSWFKTLGLKPNPEFCVQEIRGAKLYAPNGKTVELRSKEGAGYILERKIFEKHLAIEAVKKGAKIIAKANVESVKKENGKVLVSVNHESEKKEFSADLIIAADGIDSRIARMLGMNTVNKLVDVDSGYQYEMTGIDGYEEDLLHLFFGNEIARRGYLWIFPKRKNTANVGIGIGGAVEKTAKKFLDEFIASHPNLSKGSVIEVNAGGIPVGGFLENMVLDNLIVVGDAAHQVDPIHGGGIGIAMEAGAIAAEVAAEAFKAKDLSQKFLSKYNKLWYERRGNNLMKRLRGRHLLERLSDDDFSYLAESLDMDEIMKIAHGTVDPATKLIMVTKKLVKRPGLAAIMAKYIVD